MYSCLLLLVYWNPHHFHIFYNLAYFRFVSDSSSCLMGVGIAHIFILISIPVAFISFSLRDAIVYVSPFVYVGLYFESYTLLSRITRFTYRLLISMFSRFSVSP